MSIDDLWEDIREMEDDGIEDMPDGGPNRTFYDDMVAIAVAYDNGVDRVKCREMQEDFSIKHKYKINIC